MLGEPISLNDDFRSILDQLEKTDDNLFITGRAGTGKSTLLQLFRNTTKKRTVVLAPTGIAALNVRGQTIHSFFGFPPRMLNKSDIGKRRNHTLYKKAEVIIIDEISMVRADMIDNIDYFLRVNRNINKPFGGVQMVFFGDLFQLPPVVASQYERKIFVTRYNTPYFFSSDIISSEEFHYRMIELHEVFRQDERRFINLLDSIRLNYMDYDELEDLNGRNVPVPKDRSYYITLSSRNAIADQINQTELTRLKTNPYNYPAYIEGEFNPALYPTESMLTLKHGAQVMFVKNDPQKRFVNGTIGIITDIGHEHIEVSIQDDLEIKKIQVEKLEWEILKYQEDKKETKKIKTKVIGTFKQYPLKLAWAITIHKSQGKTFEKVIIDMGRGAFEYGQTYVALSRCKTYEGIILKNPIKPSDIMVDDKVREYYERLRYYS